MRRLIAFPCAGETLVGTLDKGTRPVGLLIVAGGNEIRAGAHRGMALLAARLAERGHPVLRFDRRGIGDSSGRNLGYAHAGADIAAAVHAFREAYPGIRIAAFGNCDAATALALSAGSAGIDALVLANPWLAEAGPLPPAAAIRARYCARLRDPVSWRRTLTGKVNIAMLLRGLRKIARIQPATTPEQVRAISIAFSHFPGQLSVVLAQQDATALAFAAAWRGRLFRDLRARVDMTLIVTASHSFARAQDSAALEAAILAALEKCLPRG